MIFAYLWTWLFYAGYSSPAQLCSGKDKVHADLICYMLCCSTCPHPLKESDDTESLAGKSKEKEKDAIVAVDATNLDELEISSSSSS